MRSSSCCIQLADFLMYHPLGLRGATVVRFFEGFGVKLTVEVLFPFFGDDEDAVSEVLEHPVVREATEPTGDMRPRDAEIVGVFDRCS